MKKSIFTLAALVLVSASSLSASAQSSAGPGAVSGTIPRPQAVSGTIPRPQSVLGGIYAVVMQFFGF